MVIRGVPLGLTPPPKFASLGPRRRVRKLWGKSTGPYPIRNVLRPPMEKNQCYQRTSIHHEEGICTQATSQFETMVAKREGR